MAYVTPEYVAKMQLEENLVYWKITDPNKKIIFREQLNPIGINESREILQDFLTNCQGDYIVVCFYSEKPKKGSPEETMAKRLELKVKLKSEINNYKPAAISGIGYQEYNNLREKLFKLELEHQKKELEREYQKEPTFLEKLLENDKVQLIVTALITKMAESKAAAAPVAIAGNETDELTNVLIRMSKIDPDYKNTLTKLVQYLEKNPAVLNQIKPIFGA